MKRGMLILAITLIAFGIVGLITTSAWQSASLYTDMASYGNTYGMMGPGMMRNGGMAGNGMMSGGMMSRDQMQRMMGQNIDVDRMFLQMMISHHQAAIAMAQQALAQAEHPEIKTLAQGIITTQRAEITEMQGYLT